MNKCLIRFAQLFTNVQAQARASGGGCVKRLENIPVFRLIDAWPPVDNPDIGLLRVLLNTRFQQHPRSEEHTSELQSRGHLVCRLLLAQQKVTSPRRGNTSTRSTTPQRPRPTTAQA